MSNETSQDIANINAFVFPLFTCIVKDKLAFKRRGKINFNCRNIRIKTIAENNTVDVNNNGKLKNILNNLSSC